MNIANLNEMARHDLGIEYKYKDHDWINQQINCSCIIAICTDVEPTQEDCRVISKLFTKNNTLQSLINETVNSNDEQIKVKFDQFSKELEEVGFELKQFINAKRKEFNFPVGIDFNTDYYYLKLKKGDKCNNP